MKTCSRCKLDRPLDAFHKNKSHQDGRQRYCKACRVDYSKEHYEKDKAPYKARTAARNKIYRKQIREWLNEQKDQPCADCKRIFHPFQMDFDHVRGEKLFDISQVPRYGKSKEMVQKEIDKCELVCACCHRLRTHKRNIAG